MEDVSLVLCFGNIIKEIKNFRIVLNILFVFDIKDKNNVKVFIFKVNVFESFFIKSLGYFLKIMTRRTKKIPTLNVTSIATW